MRDAVRRPLAFAGVALMTLPAACSKANHKASPRNVTVFAAASLTESFATLAQQFEAAHTGVTVKLVFGPSTDLARQIVAGADADVYAAASASSIAPVSKANLVDAAAVTFARNRLEIAVPASNPAHVAGLADLGRGGVTFAVCAVEVPCGAAAMKLLAAAGVTAAPVTYERDVKAVLAKVRLGEVDAGLVYRTDIHAEAIGPTPGKVTGVDIPESTKAVNDYPIVTIKRSAGSAKEASAFVAYVLSARGRTALTDAGFDAP
ncbi:MAG: molybdate ABC transporter substrate-binding protein [Actinomycetota bacterium]